MKKNKFKVIIMALIFLVSLAFMIACSCDPPDDSNGGPYPPDPLPEPPSQPTLNISQAANGDITIKWQEVEGAESYNIYRSSTRIGEKTRIEEGVTETTFTDTEPNENRFANYYWVVAVNEEDESFVTVSWNYVDGAQNYWIYRREDYAAANWTTPAVGRLAVVAAGEFLDRLSFSYWVSDFDINDNDFVIVPVNASGNTAADDFFGRVREYGGRLPGSGWTNPEGNFGTTPFPRTAPRMIDNWRNRPKSNPNGSRSAYQGYNVVNRIEDPQLISFHSEMFGPHMIVFWEEDGALEIEREINRIGDAMRTHANVAQFSADRYAFYFMPGEYNFLNQASLGIGFYMTIAGLGLLPTDTALNFPGSRGGIHAHVALPLWNNAPNGTNATHNFWRKAENFHIDGLLEWSVSQAAPVRRIKVDGTTGYNYRNGWASGGFAADMYFNGSVIAGSQQQWYTRSSHFEAESMTTAAWNTFTNASTGIAHANNYNSTGNAAWLNEGMERMREKPFLFFCTEEENYKVFVPGLRQNAEGISWSATSPGPGEILDLDEFFVAREGDSAELINAHLAGGRNLILSPGLYKAEVPIFVGLADTVVLGIGMATIGPHRGNIEGALMVSDVPGVTVASLTIDAYYASKYQLRVGEVGSNRDHSANPTFIFDVFARVGGHYHHGVHTEVSVQINSNNVVGDHFWIWRADHGRGIRWDRNAGTFGLVVTGNNVTMHGLFVEHYQQYQAVWTGEHGRIFFFQCETPYDFPFQVYSHAGDVQGWASVKVCNEINNFTGVGFGIYGVHNQYAMRVENAIEVPHREDVWLRNIMTNEIGSRGGRTNNVVNGVGRATGATGQIARVIEFRNGVGSYRHFSTGNTIHTFNEFNSIEPLDGDLNYLLTWVMQPCGAGIPTGWDPIWNMRPSTWTQSRAEGFNPVNPS